MRLRGGVYPQDQSIRQYPFGSGGGGLDADDALPWLIDVDVVEQAVSHVGFDNIQANTLALLNLGKYNSSTQNDEINFDLVLAQGTWDVEVMHDTGASRGIISVQFDGVEKGTIDPYNASISYNNLSSVTGIAVAVSAKVRLKLKIATKNASSSGYFCQIQHIQLRRTA